MKITIVGGGNVGTLISGQFTLKGHKVTIYTRDTSKWSKEISIYDNDVSKEYKYTPYKITDNIEEAVSDADIIFIVIPSYAIKTFIDKAEEYIKPNTWIGFYPGTGGVEFISKKLLEKGCTIFGTQRICSVVRLKKYGEYVVTTGKRDEIFIGVLPYSQGEIVRKTFSELFDIKTTLLPNYLNVTLTPSNPILHPSRLYTLYKDYIPGKIYQKIPLFYEDWTNETSEVLINCDSELQNVLSTIDFDTSYIKSLLEHYESKNKEELTAKIHSIKGFKGIESPYIKVEEGYIPDLQNRYFTADFPYGIVIIKNFAMICHIDTPQIDKIISWYQKIIGKEYIDIPNNKLGRDSHELSLPELYGIKSKKDIIDFYVKENNYDSCR